MEYAEELEYRRVNQELARRCASGLGQELALGLAPLESIERAKLRQELTAEARRFPYDLAGLRDPRLFLQSLKEGAQPQGSDFLELARVLELAGELKGGFQLELTPRLFELATGLGDHANLLAHINQVFGPDGKVKENASPTLRRLSRELEAAKNQVHTVLQQFMDRHSDLLQDRFITQRRERFVIPVKAEQAGRELGLVVESSSSGASVFFEPAAAVKLNNHLAELTSAWEAELNRILAELAALVTGDPDLPATLATLAQLDLIRAQAQLAEDWALAAPEWNPSGTYYWEALRHPLVKEAVANDLELSEANRLVLVSGPNMGGKTALLKALGLGLWMAQSGLGVAARQAQLFWPGAVFCDIGDEQSLAGELSTYGSHLLRLRAILEQAGAGDLVLIDELGTGTDPEEGAALAWAFLEALLMTGARALVTTHLGVLKSFPASHPGSANAAMRFDSDFRPTYRLEVGPPGRSLALAAAKRIGFPASVLLRAEELIDPNTREVGAILAQLEALLNQADQNAQAAAAERKNLQAEREVLRARLAQIENEREQVITTAREEADLELARLQEQVKNLRAQAKSGQKSEALRTIEQLRRDYRPKTPSVQLEVEPGQEVFVTSYGKKAWVLERREGQAVVQLGAIRATVPLSEIKPVAATAVNLARGGVTTSRESWELDLRGFTAEEAVLAVHDFLSEAVASGAGAARILHGKGTGVLREAIRRELARDKRVSSFHDAMPYQGGHGVTEVEL